MSLAFPAISCIASKTTSQVQQSKLLKNSQHLFLFNRQSFSKKLKFCNDFKSFALSNRDREKIFLSVFFILIKRPIKLLLKKIGFCVIIYMFEGKICQRFQDFME